MLLTYCGAAATVEMCINEFVNQYPEPLATASVADVAAILTPAAELEAARAKAPDEKTKEETEDRGVPVNEILSSRLASLRRSEKDMPYIQIGHCLDRLRPRFWPLRVQEATCYQLSTRVYRRRKKRFTMAEESPCLTSLS